MCARILLATLAAAFACLSPTTAAAQSSAVPTVTLNAGWAGFVDDGRVDHGAFGGGLEWVLTPRLAIGPEVLYMVGPEDDRDLFVLGVARLGILPLRSRVAPFVTLGAGTMTHSDRFGSQSYRSTEGAFIAGGGARITVSPRVYVAPEFTVGWEPHIRASVTVGIRLP
ncbi:hypothetical protein TBR22_A05890 [Luteitalea sp. TBR-22]|uniref:outer membrane beta-barrel protein n=1 Tax=Luteitalea sp. TBR-22 TaxID=2802971 RepID=UPI001AF4603E|nr:outer membrane beta-barrel protein [Luteitalea sp. TBR-22]BCS31388.1 hypothetical protein TBR22_A05890 [Luteitalea sp. TBR-22]